MLPSHSSTTPPYAAQDSAPKGLTAAWQREIATAQAQAASMDRPYRPSNRSFPSSASLYVGELDPSVQESTLYEIFSQCGPLESVRVCRDAITQRSLGYAFVNFKTHVDGERALHTLNYTTINGKPCRIMWSQRDLAKRKASGGNIFVRNLDPSVTTKSLHDTFAQYGSIVSCKVVTDVNGQSKGYGFVNYDTIEAAENAIQHANGTTVYNRELFVGHHIPKRERQQHRIEEAKKRFTNVYVKNLMPDIKEEELKELFSGFGPIVSVLIQRDEAGNSKGFGFVNFERHEDAERAVQQMNDTEYIGRRLYVSRAQKRSEREERHHSTSEHYPPVTYLSPTEQHRAEHHPPPPPHHHHHQQPQHKSGRYQGMNVYIKYLDDQVDDQRLRDEFSKFGTITSAKVMRDENGKSKGYGFVCFSSPQEAIKAVNDMNGRILSTKAIYVALAQKREDRRSSHIDPGHPMAPRTNQLHLQQPFIPAMPVSSYVTSGPIYYDYTAAAAAAAVAAYPSDMVSPSPGRPHRGWTHAPPQPATAAAAGAPPPPMTSYIKPGYPVHISYVNYVGPPPPPHQQQQQQQQHGTRPPMYTPVMDTNAVRPASTPRNAPDGNQAFTPRPGSPVAQQQQEQEQEEADKEATSEQGSPHQQQPPPLTIENISSYPEETQNQILGERVYAVVHRTFPELAGKVTGMLLEMDKEDLISLINDPPSLESKAAEAVNVLEQHRANQPEDD